MNLDLTDSEASLAATALRKQACKAEKKGKTEKAETMRRLATKLGSAWIRSRLGSHEKEPLSNETSSRLKEAELALERGAGLHVEDREAKERLKVLVWTLERQRHVAPSVNEKAIRGAAKCEKGGAAKAYNLIADRLAESASRGEETIVAVWFGQAIHAITMGQDVKQIGGGLSCAQRSIRWWSWAFRRRTRRRPWAF
jgi:hypothetical protein